jgi:hypothetical protein
MAPAQKNPDICVRGFPGHQPQAELAQTTCLRGAEAAWNLIKGGYLIHVKQRAVVRFGS